MHFILHFQGTQLGFPTTHSLILCYGYIALFDRPHFLAERGNMAKSHRVFVVTGLQLKISSDLKQIGTQEKKSFSGTILNHGFLSGVTRLSHQKMVFMLVYHFV